MSNNHNNVQRYGDEYQCSDCGKSWDKNDIIKNDVPDCTIDTRLVVEPKTSDNKLIAELNANIRGLKMLLDRNELTHRVQWSPSQWYEYYNNKLNIQSLRGIIDRTQPPHGFNEMTGKQPDRKPPVKK